MVNPVAKAVESVSLPFVTERFPMILSRFSGQ